MHSEHGRCAKSPMAGDQASAQLLIMLLRCSISGRCSCWQSFGIVWRPGRYVSPPEALAERLGQTVERLRRAYNLSLGSLSEQSGVAKSIISQIERNETNPTLSTLLKLSRALNTSVEDLLAGSREQSAFIEHQGVTATPVLFSQDGLCRLRIIGWLKTVELVQWYDFTAEPGGILESEGHPAGSIENLSVLAGTLLVRSGDAELKLGAKQ
eukprot:TRINITY_DN59039_c1_g2_i1.p1 TRINITY_DN59039_c1_g2~~TRINITY_DN59039_c1_g2_i1.p1  ORF type:complete len:211 (+),score=3.50 TRINITY_DN59039_c1_g2_i1:142-774(+)